MTTREITNEQYDEYCRLCDEREQLRAMLETAPTLAAKLEIRRQMANLATAARGAIDA